jgi:hypothetical protein
MSPDEFVVLLSLRHGTCPVSLNTPFPARAIISLPSLSAPECIYTLLALHFLIFLFGCLERCLVPRLPTCPNRSLNFRACSIFSIVQHQLVTVLIMYEPTHMSSCGPCRTIMCFGFRASPLSHCVFQHHHCESSDKCLPQALFQQNSHRFGRDGLSGSSAYHAPTSLITPESTPRYSSAHL